MPRWRSAGLCLLAVGLFGLPVGGDAAGQTDLVYGVVWYTRPTPENVALCARRMSLGITGREELDQGTIKAQNPDFQWFVYNSVTDNYVPPQRGADEHAALEALASRKGWGLEEIYLHYAEDTRLVLRGDTLFIPGWPHGKARTPAEARVLVYDPSGSRRVVNFSTPRSLQLNKEVFVDLAFSTPFTGTQIYPDGIFLDNGTAELFNFGTVLSGGEVTEAGGAVVGSPAFQSWHWKKNLAPFLSALRDTVATAARWTPDHRPKRVMLNVANVWDESYVSRHVADILFLETQYNPIRNSGADAVDEAYHHDRTAADAGITSFYSAAMSRSVSGRRGEMSYDSVLLGNLAWYLVTRTEHSILFQMGTNAPNEASWDTLTWRGCMETANKQLGRPTGPPYTLAQGTDPTRHPYVVKARRYENGMALVRNRGDWKEDLGPETRVTVKLPVPMAPITPSGRITPTVTELTLRNGEGAVLVGSP